MHVFELTKHQLVIHIAIASYIVTLWLVLYLYAFVYTQGILCNIKVEFTKVECEAMKQKQNISRLEKKMEMMTRELSDFQNKLMVIIHACTHM